jgi:hypothetical protein
MGWTVVDEDRVVEAEPQDAVCNLAGLFLRVGPRIPRIGARALTGTSSVCKANTGSSPEHPAAALSFESGFFASYLHKFLVCAAPIPVLSQRKLAQYDIGSLAEQGRC